MKVKWQRVKEEEFKPAPIRPEPVYKPKAYRYELYVRVEYRSAKKWKNRKGKIYIVVKSPFPLSNEELIDLAIEKASEKDNWVTYVPVTDSWITYIHKEIIEEELTDIEVEVVDFDDLGGWR